MNHSSSESFPFEEIYRRYLDGLLTSDRQKCRVNFEQWLESTPQLRSIYDDLVRRSLYEVGEQWEQGKISVATEQPGQCDQRGSVEPDLSPAFRRAASGEVSGHHLRGQ